MSEQFHIPNYLTIAKLEPTSDGGFCFIAFHPELHSIISQGETADEAKQNLIEATELAIEHLVSNGLAVPEPTPINAAHTDSRFTEPTPSHSFTVINWVQHRDEDQPLLRMPAGAM